MNSWLAASVLTLLLSPTVDQENPRKPPKEPEERFAVFVYAVDNAEAGGEHSIPEVVDEVKAKLQKRKRWFLLAPSPEKAELVVEILGHRVEARMEDVVRSFDFSTTALGPPTEPVLVETHYINSRLEGLGYERSLTGTLERKTSGGNLGHAASSLAQKLEKFVKDHYWQMTEWRFKLANQLWVNVDQNPSERSGSSPQPEPSSSPATDSISLESITPPSGTILISGHDVTISGTLRYTFASANSGRITLVIHDQDGRSIQNTSARNLQPSALISKGIGTLTLSDEITIPTERVTSVDVFFALANLNALVSNTVVLVTYPVE
jgi:hypothetical protein